MWLFNCMAAMVRCVVPLYFLSPVRVESSRGELILFSLSFHSFDSFFLSSDYLFKLVLIGDSGVGKSCLLLRFAVSRTTSQRSESSRMKRPNSPIGVGEEEMPINFSVPMRQQMRFPFEIV